MDRLVAGVVVVVEPVPEVMAVAGVVQRMPTQETELLVAEVAPLLTVMAALEDR